MKVVDFDYNLPKELIANNPVSPRSYSKLMIICKNNKNNDIDISHRRFYNIIDYLKKGDLLILNKTKVMQAKINACKATGGKVEVILYSSPKKNVEAQYYEESKYVINALVKSTNVNIGDILVFGKDIELSRITYGEIKKGALNKRLNDLKKDKKTFAEIINRDDDIFTLKFNIPFDDVMEEFGVYPLPSYIKDYKGDMEKYQTVYSKKTKSANQMSVAAPTSGLHYTKNLLRKIKKKGVKIAYVNLAIGLGTFKILLEENVKDNKLHEELFFIDKKNAELINNHNGRIFINGTTALRAVESATDKDGLVYPICKTTDLFCYPGYKFTFKFDGIITNFHLPQSSLIMLISAWFGKIDTFKIYKIAVKEKYRFFSFGDAMFLKVDK